jgi:hypothetical protein
MRVTAYEMRVYLVEFEADTEDEQEAIELVATGEADEVESVLDMVFSRDDIRVRREL